MKKHLLSATVVLALIAPGAANAAGGYLDLGYSSAGSSGSSSNVDTISYGGAVNFDMTSSLEAQADVHFARIDASGSHGTFSNANLHIFHRTESYLFGGFFGTEDFGSADIYNVGLEGQYYLSRLTLEAGAGVSGIEASGSDAQGSVARVGATYFFTDSFSVGAGARWAEIDGGSNNSLLSVEGEWKPESMPVSFFLGYRSSDGFLLSSEELDTWALGARWSFGSGSLFERNRSGAGLSTNGTLVGGAF